MTFKNKILLASPIPPVLGSTIVYLLSGVPNAGVNDSSQKDGTSINEEAGDKTEDSAKPKIETYKDYFTNNHTLWLVDQYSTIPHLKGIILQDTNPAIYEDKKLYEKDQLFPGSPELYLKVKQQTTSDKKQIQILDMDEQALALKKACVNILDQEMDKEQTHLEKLKKWCVSPTIQTIATKWGFDLPQDSSSDNFKTNRWISNEDGTYSEYAKKHKFIKEEDFNSAKSETSKKLKMMFACTPEYKRPYGVNDNPALDISKMDYFQQVTLFCSEATTAGEYLSSQFQITEFNEVNDQDKDNYFYQEGKDINYYKGIKTSDPMDGKSFWGAVRFLYGKRKNKTI